MQSNYPCNLRPNLAESVSAIPKMVPCLAINRALLLNDSALIKRTLRGFHRNFKSSAIFIINSAWSMCPGRSLWFWFVGKLSLSLSSAYKMNCQPTVSLSTKVDGNFRFTRDQLEHFS